MTLSTYDQDTYQQPFEDDFDGATIYIGIRSPYLAKKAIERWEWFICKALKRGIPVCVFTELPWYLRGNYWLNPDEESDKKVFLECVQLLKDMGVHVTLLPKIHEKIIIIDYRILWKGSINVLSNDPYKKTETVERETDLFKVTSAFYRFNFETCVNCVNIQWSKIRGALTISSQSIEEQEQSIEDQSRLISTINSLDPNTSPEHYRNTLCQQQSACSQPVEDVDGEPISKWIAALRKCRNLSVTQLANKTNVDRTRVGRLESGRALPSLTALVAIFEALGYSLVMVPKETVPLVRKIAKGFNRAELSKIIAEQEK